MNTTLTKTISLFLIYGLILASCSGATDEEKLKVLNKGEVIVANGKDVKDTIKYSCIGCEENLSDVTIFNKIVNEATDRMRNGLKYPLSFIPKGLELTIIKEDSLYSFSTNNKINDVLLIIADNKYIAKNGYGNELEGESTKSFYVQNGKIKDLKDDIKLPDLEIKDENINRDLTIYSVDNEKSIQIIPTIKKSLIVISTLRCVDEGSWLVIKLSNEKEVKLVSWNDFNCEGTSYFNEFNKEQIVELTSNKVKSIMIVDEEGISCEVPKNQSDYFQQLVKLLYR